MRVYKKVNRAYDARQKSYLATTAKLDSKKRLGYKKPGSKNPRKHGA